MSCARWEHLEGLVLVWQLGRAAVDGALLEGVWVFLAMWERLDHYDLSRLRRLAETFFHPHGKK